MDHYSQHGRLLVLETPLGTDVLLLSAFQGREELSQLFSYRLDMLSEDSTVTPEAILGKSVTWSVEHFDEEPRYFNGVVRRFVALDRQIQGLRLYRAEVVPWAWFLTRTADCRIFQNKSVPDIIRAVFETFGFNDYEFDLDGSYPTHEFRVQYRETAFDFISRLMEQEGIFYYFRHEEGIHTMVLGDSPRAFRACREDDVRYSVGSISPNHVSAWERQYEFLSGRWTQTDYNFQTPNTSLLSSTDTLLDTPNLGAFERFDYPGIYGQLPDGRTATKVRMEEEEARYDVATGASTCCTFTPGGKFSMAGHDCDGENRGYVVASVEHRAVDNSYSSEGTGSKYGNTFTCIPDSVNFRPSRRTPRAVVRGPQTAVVVGPGGEEIYTDQYGRVKVQFFWDRQGRFDEDSSCWIRVAESWAGKNFGAVFNPRIGQEVVVEFLEGDPDRPLITGRVYNAVQMPPYPLPGQQSRSGIRTQSTPGGDPGMSNELYFEDQAGEEDVYFHAQKDFHRVVEDHDDLQVHNDQTINIAVSSTMTAGESIELSVGENSIKIDQTGITITALKVTITGETGIAIESPASISIESASFDVTAGAVQIGEGDLNISAAAMNVEAATVNIVAMTTIDGVPGPYIPVPV